MPVTKKFVHPIVGALLERMQEVEEDDIPMESEPSSIQAEERDVKIEENITQKTQGCEEVEERKMKWFNHPFVSALFGGLLAAAGFVLISIFTPIGKVNSEDIKEIKEDVRIIESRLTVIEREMVTEDQLNNNTLIILEAIDNIGE